MVSNCLLNISIFTHRQKLLLTLTRKTYWNKWQWMKKLMTDRSAQNMGWFSAHPYRGYLCYLSSMFRKHLRRRGPKECKSQKKGEGWKWYPLGMTFITKMNSEEPGLLALDLHSTAHTNSHREEADLWIPPLSSWIIRYWWMRGLGSYCLYFKDSGEPTQLNWTVPNLQSHRQP